MPYAVNAELPEHVRGALPEAAQTRFRQVTSEVLGDGGSEKSAINKAWSTIKQGWQKGEKGKWVRKSIELGEATTDLIEKIKPRTLYVCCSVVNAAEIIKWAKGQGFKTTLTPEDLHVTICYSRMPLDWMKISTGWNGDEKGNVTVKPGGPRLIEPLGDKGAVVLLFQSDDLTWRHESIIRAGASHDFQGYQPHITITWDAEGLDLSQVEPYTGEIVLGPEEFKEVNDHWADNITEKCLYAMQDAGLIRKDAGWGSVRSSGGGNPYHNPTDGKFTTGPGGGGVAHFAAHTAGKVAVAAGVTSAFKYAGDWYADSGKHRPDSDSAKAIHDKLSEPKTQHSVASTVAKEVLHALVVVGVEIAAATAIGKAARVLMPFLSGPAKQLATSAAAVVIGRVVSSIGRGASLKLVVSAVKSAAKRKVGLGKAEITTDDLVTFQLQRLEAVLQDLDLSDLAVQRAHEYLKSTNPEMLKNILNDLEDAGFTDLEETVADHAMDARVVKVDQSLGLVFGWAIICKQDGKDYYDLNIDKESGERVPEHIPEQAMLEASADFMENSRIHKEMHDGDSRGTAVFAFPMTSDIAKAMGIETKTTGLLVAMKPDAKLLAKYASGELKGFSIGGSREKVENITE